MPPDHPALRVSYLGKRYIIGGSQENYLTIRDAIVNFMKVTFKRFNRAPPSGEFLSAQRMCRSIWIREML